MDREARPFPEREVPLRGLRYLFNLVERWVGIDRSLALECALMHTRALTFSRVVQLVVSFPKNS